MHFDKYDLRKLCSVGPSYSRDTSMMLLYVYVCSITLYYVVWPYFTGPL